METMKEQKTVSAPAARMPFHVYSRPDFAFLLVKLGTGRAIRVETTSMATMDTNLRMKTTAKRGVGRVLTGESLFINEFIAEGAPGEIGIAPSMPGDIQHIYLQGQTVYLQNSSFLACSETVDIGTQVQGLVKGVVSGMGLFLIRCTGHGDLWTSGYGAIVPMDVRGEAVVDTGHIVAFTEGLEYGVGPLAGYKSLFFSGEGFVCRFHGEGRVWIQTRKVPPFTKWINPFRPRKGKKGPLDYATRAMSSLTGRKGE